MKTKITKFDAAEYLDTPEAIVAYLSAVLEENDAARLAAALGDIARSKGMGKVALAADVNREGLYRSLSPNGNPELSTVMKVMDVMGLRLDVRTKASMPEIAPA